LTAATVKSSPPIAFSSRSSAGISVRQGTHQVAQRLKSTVLPANALRLVSVPSGALKARSARYSGSIAVRKAATSPRAKGAAAAASFGVSVHSAAICG
jgi:hypothetical protein